MACTARQGTAVPAGHFRGVGAGFSVWNHIFTGSVTMNSLPLSLRGHWLSRWRSAIVAASMVTSTMGGRTSGRTANRVSEPGSHCPYRHRPSLSVPRSRTVSCSGPRLQVEIGAGCSGMHIGRCRWRQPCLSVPMCASEQTHGGNRGHADNSSRPGTSTDLNEGARA